MTKCCPKCHQELPPRACEVCGADISDRTRKTRVCSKRCYNRLPETQEKKRIAARKFHRTPEGRAYQEEWLARPGNKEKVRASQRRYAARKREKQRQEQSGGSDR